MSADLEQAPHKVTSAPFRKTLPALGILIGTVLLIFLIAMRKPTPPETEVKEKEWLVNAVPATLSEAQPQLALLGKVESPHASELSAAISADVASVSVREGSTVRQGDLLAQLQAREWQLSLQQREADLKEARALLQSEQNRYSADRESLLQEQTLLGLAEKQVARQQRLNQNQLVSQERLDDAQALLAQRRLSVTQRSLAIEDHQARVEQLQARVSKALAAVERAKLDLAYTEIRAPFDAVVTAVYVAPGERVQPGLRLLSLVDRSQLEIRAQLPDRYVSQVRQALDRQQQVSGHAQHHGSHLALRLSRLSGQSSAGGVDVFLTPVAPNPSLALGTTVSVQLSLPAQSEVLSLPQSALYGVNRIYRIVDGRLDLLEVEVVGKRFSDGEGDQVLVSAPTVRPDDRIVSTQLPNAVSGLKVRERER